MILPLSSRFPHPARVRARFIPPCSPVPAKAPPTGDAWLHEPKLDGYRLQIVKEGHNARLYSRRGNDWTRLLATVAEACRGLPLVLRSSMPSSCCQALPGDPTLPTCTAELALRRRAACGVRVRPVAPGRQGSARTTAHGAPATPNAAARQIGCAVPASGRPSRSSRLTRRRHGDVLSRTSVCSSPALSSAWSKHSQARLCNGEGHPASQVPEHLDQICPRSLLLVAQRGE
jgi:hypothetical protein